MTLIVTAGRDARCPICRQETTSVLQIQFGEKMHLPSQVDLRYCGFDNFLFVADGCQASQDRYYAAIANDTYHREIATAGGQSPIAKTQCGRLMSALGDSVATPKNVLDFGCGQGDLLIELAQAFPNSSFAGLEPGPAAETFARQADLLGLKNVRAVVKPDECGPYDLVILSHVMEHLVDLSLTGLFPGLLRRGGALYVEVPNALRYDAYPRREFLYYFDRLHVNHFTPHALRNLMAAAGFGCSDHF